MKIVLITNSYGTNLLTAISAATERGSSDTKPKS